MSTQPNNLAIYQLFGYFCALVKAVNKRLQSYMI